jgi:hypothetical protein
MFFEVYTTSRSSTTMASMSFIWLIMFNPETIPMIITGVAIASATSALGVIIVTLLIPRIGRPVFGLMV